MSSLGNRRAERFRNVYDFDIDPSSDSTHAKILQLVGSNKDVLELGCATGYMSKHLSERGCRVTGLEIDPLMAEHAREHCDRVVVGDLDTLALDQEFPPEAFDVVVAADVLEHLKDPVRVLESVRGLLRSDGYVVTSVPNIAHGSVRLALLTGDFRYQERGLLDRTHLRFFTAETVVDMVESAGFVIGSFDRQELLIDRSEIAYDASELPPGIVEYLQTMPDATTYHFILVAYPAPRANLTFLQTRFRALTADVASLKHALEDQCQHVKESSDEREGLTEQNRTLVRDAATLNARLQDVAASRDQMAEQNGILGRDIAHLNARLQDVVASRDQQQEQFNHLLETHIARVHEAIVERSEMEQRLSEVRQQVERLTEENRNLERECEKNRITVSEASAQVEEMAARVAQLTQQRKELRDKLIVAHDQLFERDAALSSYLSQADSTRGDSTGRIGELEELLRQRDAYIQEKERHVADLQSALDRILYSVPGTMFRRARAIVTLGRR